MAANFVRISNQRIDTSTALGYSAMTVMFWVKATALVAQAVLDKTATIGSEGWSIRLLADGSFVWRVGGGTINTDAGVYPSAYEVGVWTHLAIRSDFSDDGEGNIYCENSLVKDGVSQGSQSTLVFSTSLETITTVRIGRSNLVAEATDNFGGLLDDVRIYNGRLFDSVGDKQEKTIFGSRGRDTIFRQTGGTGASLQLRYTFMEGYPGQVMSGAGVVKDLSPNKYDGTPFSSPTWQSSILTFKKQASL